MNPFNAQSATLGFTTSISAGAMGSPAIATSKDCGAMIRSVTVGNQTSTVTAVIFLSAIAQGQPIMAVGPGNWQTIPVQETSGISVLFVTQAGQSANGSVYLHVDPEPLAASGFTAATGPALWVWDQSLWDGGAVWST